MTERGERVKKVMEYFGLNKNSFSNEIGMSSNVTIGRIINEDRNPHPDTLKKITDRYPQISLDWLMTGTGQMLLESCPGKQSNPQIPDAYMVPLLPLYAQGGSLNDFAPSVRMADCEKVISPIAGADFAITITGDSMAPEYPSGSRILIKRVDEKAFIEWGRVYVLDTMNGTVVKEVRKGNSDDEVMCYSLNPDPKFQPFAVKFSSIFGFYKVMLCLSLK